MKRPLQLSLAIALAISGIDAMALGLGSIQVKSRLNQPLEAEIPVIQSNPGEAEGLIVQLASAEDFERVGLDRARSTAVPLEFKLVRNAQGQTVIRVTTADVVRDPFLDLLIEANWTNGRLLREYTVLLDPPVMAAALQGSTTVAASPEPERARVEPLPAATPKPAPKTSAAPPPVARAPVAPSAPRPVAAADGDYAVQQGDTLSGIARQVRPGADVSVDQTMLAIFKANPSAFYKDNINALKSGAILRIPDAESIRAVGSLREAAEQVRGQVEDWRGVAGSPTRVARTAGEAEPPRAASASTRTADDSRLAIVPPAVGKDSLAASDRVGASSAAGGNGDTRLKNDLSRAQEALASREQETGELKSRVRELEDLKNKNDRLLSLKDSEIAELQQRLKALQEGQGGKTAASAAPAAVTAAPTSTTPATGTDAPATPTKDDIWGRGDAATDTPTAAQTPAAATPSQTSDSAPVPATPAPAATAPAATPETASSAAPVPGDAITATGTDTAPPSTPPATPAKPPAATPKPAAKATPKPVTPVPADSPWFMDPKVLGGAGAIGLLLVLLGVVGLRKRRKPVERSSIAESFGDSPLPAAALAGTAAVAAADPIEAALRAQIDANPADLGARLELLSHFYAERRVEDFEAGALDMNDYVIDRSQPEWLEVQAMGRELLPGNPLFTEPGGYAEPMSDASDEASFDEAFAFDAPAADPFEPAAAPAPATEFDFDFDAPSPARIDEPVAPPAAATTSVEPADDDGFDFGDLPPLDFQSEIDAAARDAAERANLAEEAVPAASLDDEFFVGDDAVNTKLDLARTYLDMGDPDGARAMLEEVLSEGSQVQKDEARRLLDGIV